MPALQTGMVSTETEVSMDDRLKELELSSDRSGFRETEQSDDKQSKQRTSTGKKGKETV